MQVDEDKINISSEESVFSGDLSGLDVVDEFDDGDHPLEDDEILSTPHDDEEVDIFDFFGDEDERDGMY